MEGINFIEIDGSIFYFGENNELEMRNLGNNNEQIIPKEE
jgi:hypothetical protein